MELQVEPTLLVGFCLVLVRATTWAMICPPFNAPSIPVRVRVGVSVALSFLLAERVGEQVGDMGTAALVGALFTQIIAGLLLGFFVFALFSAVQMAGEVLDLQVGFSMGAVLDPLSGNNSTPLGRFHQLLGVAILFAINGHVIVARAFIRSVERAPLGDINIDNAVSSLTGLLGTLLMAAIEIALPLLTALFCAELALGFLGKAAPQLNILVIGFAVKSFITFLLLGATLVLLPESVESLLGRAVRLGLGIFEG